MQFRSKHHLPVIAALGRIAIHRDVRAVQRGITNLGQPAWRFLFQLVSVTSGLPHDQLQRHQHVAGAFELRRHF
jgi:hypothetical protein